NRPAGARGHGGRAIENRLPGCRQEKLLWPRSPAVGGRRLHTRRAPHTSLVTKGASYSYLRVEKWDLLQAANVKTRRKRLRLGACPIFQRDVRRQGEKD